MHRDELCEPKPGIVYVLTNDAAKICGVSPDTIRLWERNGRLPAAKTLSGVRLFERSAVERLAQRRQDDRAN